MVRVTYEPISDTIQIRSDKECPYCSRGSGSIQECDSRYYREVYNFFEGDVSPVFQALYTLADKCSCNSLSELTPISIAGAIRVPIRCIAPEILYEIENQLTLPNPAYEQAKWYGYRSGRYIVPSVPKDLTFYKEGSYLEVPRGFLDELLNLLGDVPVVLLDRTVTTPVTFRSKIDLHEYQVPLVETAVREGFGILSSPPGSGKTVMGLEVIARLGQRTLWLIDSHELVRQTLDRASSFLELDDGDLGVYSGGKRILGNLLTIATLQTVHRDVRTPQGESLRRHFGLIVQDEAHIAPAPTYCEVIAQLDARYRLGLTATPYRGDNLTPVMFWVLGPLLSRIDAKTLHRAGEVVLPEVLVCGTSFSSLKEDFASLIRELINDYERNKLIIDVLVKEGGYSLVLSGRVAHCKALQALYEERIPGKSAVLVGSLAKGVRGDVIENINKKEITTIFATISLAAEGLDIPHLDRLALVTPTKARRVLEQAVGRVMRTVAGKEGALVLDFVDFAVPMLSRQFNTRLQLYKSLELEVVYLE